jgi:hypothetical protein
MASQIVVHSVPPSKPVTKEPKPKIKVMDWIRNGCRFPGVRP